MDRYLTLETRDVKKNYYLLVFTKIIKLFRARVAKDEKQEHLSLSKGKKTILHNVLTALQQYDEIKDFYNIKEKVTTQEQQETLETIYQQILNFYNDHNLDTAHA